MNLAYIKGLFEIAKKDFKLFSVIILGVIIVAFYHKIEGNHSEDKTKLKDCELDSRSKDMKIDTLKEIINSLVMEIKIDSIKNNKSK